MKYFLFIILVIFIYLLGAYCHESDIQRTCKNIGRSRYSTWQGEIECKLINK